MEADIRWRYHLDYRDLDLPTLAGYVRHLPEDSAVWAIGRDGPLWTLTDHLLDDLRQEVMALRGVEVKKIRPHPQRPRPPKAIDPEREKYARKRAAEHRRRKEERSQ